MNVFDVALLDLLLADLNIYASSLININPWNLHDRCFCSEFPRACGDASFPAWHDYHNWLDQDAFLTL